MTKMLSASGGLCPPDQGLCLWTPLGALPLDPRYRLVLRTRHGAPLTTDPFRRLWRHSGFMDDFTIANKPRLLDVAAQLKRSAHAALGLAINCAQ